MLYKKLYSTLFVLLLSFNILSQKTAYIPNYLLDLSTIDGQQFSWSKTQESQNFTLIWGDSAGINPLLSSDPDLVFNPSQILDTMEWIYEQFHNYNFIDDSPGTNLSVYKIPIIMLNTFGPGGAQGWAFGGDVDGVVGAFWAHPLAMQDGQVAAHELAHSIQAQIVIDFRLPSGLGGAWDNAGIFWETHANFMRNLLYPQSVTAFGMDVTHIETFGDWKNTYENYPLLFSIMQTDGINAINDLWKESFDYEYPLQAYKRIMSYNQVQLNDRIFEYVKKMATYDFTINNVGSFFRMYRNSDLDNNLLSVQSTWTILSQDTLDEKHFKVPIHLAPEEYGYNIIPLHIESDSCPVILKFKGHTETNNHSGWRYCFVSAFNDGTISRYSETYQSNEKEIMFDLEPNETQLYFVVMGAPYDDIQTNSSNDTWKGYPKHFRYPYDLYIDGAKPEGYQAGNSFRAQLKINGTIHPNGGGWVQNSASVSPSVYIGEHAIVLGNSTITGNVVIDGTAIVKDASISDNVIVTDNAIVLGGNASGSARIKGQAFSENNEIYGSALVHMRARVSNYELYGNIEVGGDVVVYNEFGSCDNGVYYRMTNYYEDNLLECDNRTAMHPENSDVNAQTNLFLTSEMQTACNCLNFEDCILGIIQNQDLNSNLKVYPIPAVENLRLELEGELGTFSLKMFSSSGEKMIEIFDQTDSKIDLDIRHLENGIYILQIQRKGEFLPQTIKIIVNH